MAPTQIKCAFPDCDFTAEHDSEQIAVLLFQSHLASHTQPTAVKSSKQKLPPIERPKLKQDITEEEWDTFTQEWKRFKRCTEIPNGQEADQLFDCCDKTLGRLILKENPEVIESGEEELLQALKRMAVIKIATCVRRTRLLTLKQDHGQSIREFYANVKAQAATCDFSVKCTQTCCHGKPAVDYTSLVVKDIIICGLSDIEIRKDVLEWPDLDSKSTTDLVGFIEGKETSKKAWSGQPADAASSSGYKKKQNEQEPSKKLSLKGSCEKCGVQMSLFTRNKSGRINKTAFTKCFKCHKESFKSQESAVDGAKQESESENSMIQGFIGSIETKQLTSPNSSLGSMSVGRRRITLDHHIFTPDGWKRALSLSHPVLRLTISINRDDYANFGLAAPSIICPKDLDTVSDSGAQSCLWSREEYLSCGFLLKDLIKVDHRMQAANRAPIRIDGAILIRLSGKDENGESIEAAVMVYISPDSKHFYLSKEAMVQLGVIPKDFPKVGAAFPHPSACSTSVDPISVTCNCAQRSPPPGMPDSLPFAACPENVPKMKEWLLKRYASSTFNKCPHKPLPKMEGPPVKFHIDPNANPIKLNKPAPVPLHWQEQVLEELNRDVALGVLERVPYGQPTEWCFRMVVTRKKDGSPRRTVDLSPLNKFCLREAHSSRSPFQLARSVPHHAHKSVFDAWNGYHSVPLREEDRKYTTFTTPWGLFRYKRAPQGFLSSGDAYNRRLDDITSHVVRLERCVDDNLLHDVGEMEEHWWRTIEFLELAGKNGVVFNYEKLQFCQPVVDFAGFRISDENIEPLPKYLDAIREFPTPGTVTDIRSWFGLVNQVAHYAQLRNALEPFRKFLSPKVPFEWNEELNAVFEYSKECIIDAIKEGVKIFDITRRTCLRTDWSNKGIGYFLSQQHCDCSSREFGCCPNGWRITLAGSRFLRDSEDNYAPVEGEGLAVAWGLEQTKFFTLGCNDLKVITDHQPLIPIFSNRRLDEIENTRLFRIKKRTLMWRFDIGYVPGEFNPFSDAISRHPSSYAEIGALVGAFDREEEDIVAGIFNDVNKFFAVTWDRVKAESINDCELQELTKLIKHGFPATKKEMPTQLEYYWDHRDKLMAWDGVVLYTDRVVVPRKLRNRVIENLHSAHQGTCSMNSRAKTVVFWPNITNDIEESRLKCRPCHRNAPSQAKIPPKEPRVPTVPFEMIYADYFKLEGVNYLIIGDRLSGWTEIFSNKGEDSAAGSKGLCKALRRIFATFGVPDDLSSDGGPEFIAGETQEMLKRWGVNHDPSSAYFPQSNGRAEVAVRITKRILEDNVGPNGSLDNDKVVRALLQLRNTPDRDCGLSAAEVLFGRRLKDSMPRLDKSVPVFQSPQIHPTWKENWVAKERAIRSRFVKTCEKLEEHSKELPPLHEGDTVFIQNQNSAHGKPNKWDREGTVIQAGKNDQYLVRVHGTGRITLRNRRFLRKFLQMRDPEYLEETSVHPLRSSVKDCPSKVTQADDSKSHIGFDHTNKDALQEDVSIAPDHSSEVPNGEGQNNGRDICSQPPCPPAPQVPDTAVNLPNGQRPEPRRSLRVPVPRKLYDATTGKYI